MMRILASVLKLEEIDVWSCNMFSQQNIDFQSHLYFSTSFIMLSMILFNLETAVGLA